MAPNILNSSLKNASFSIIFQISCRCLTFFLNAFTVRHVGEAALGVINVRLLLLESLILYLAKEPFKKACLTNTAEHNWARVMNILWMTIPTCFFFSLIGGCLWMFFLSTEEELPDYYNFAVYSVLISCMIELTSLPVEIVANAFLFIKLKIILESIMIALRTVIFIFFILENPKNALLGFGVAQIAASIFYLASHFVYFDYYIKRLKGHRLKRKLSRSGGESEEYVIAEFPFKSIRDFLPGHLPKTHSGDDITFWGMKFDKILSLLTWSFFKQGFMKQVLTEGERIIMTFLPILNFTEQGTYEVVNNLGSLAARFVFRPIEDSSYFYFTQMIKRDEPIREQNVEKVVESVFVLKYLCSLVTSLGLLILVFGYSYSSLLLWLYGGSKFIAALPVLLMRAHCLSVLLLGINGITECFMNATADSNTINKNNRIMIYGSVVFLASSYYLVKLFGPVGFILGNCVNMGLRIIHSIRFINKKYSGTDYKPLQGLIPKPWFSFGLAMSVIVTSVSHTVFFPERKFLHLSVGIAMFMAVVFFWVIENFELVSMGFVRIRDWWNRRKSE